MRALTLIQPWGGLIATGVKLIENRTWQPPTWMRGESFVIHAGAKVDRRTIEDLLDEGLTEHELWRMKSAALAVATLKGWVVDGDVGATHRFDAIADDQRRWFFGPVGFLLDNVRRLPTPVPCKGALGFWTLAPELERVVMEQLA